ncbi:uncharacterized protein B0T23DRAFT_391971 [Neurospora hispaniola]|uniref:Uncharacterized protein n=1 Tax=Neurospora hispaniola TaxID=588809 RepID=A0AAJ0MVK7_9PEZI|nr:hypothetical protein B0T23DRAFT_391971 [Neurospora hispaniola]
MRLPNGKTQALDASARSGRRQRGILFKRQDQVRVVVRNWCVAAVTLIGINQTNHFVGELGVPGHRQASRHEEGSRKDREPTRSPVPMTLILPIGFWFGDLTPCGTRCPLSAAIVVASGLCPDRKRYIQHHASPASRLAGDDCHCLPITLRPVRSGWWRELVCSNLFWADKDRESETAQWLRVKGRCRSGLIIGHQRYSKVKREDKAQGLPIRLQLVGNRPALTEAAGAQKKPRGGGGGGGGGSGGGGGDGDGGMLTCSSSSSNGIEGGVNETAVQMMDYLYDFWYGMILRRPGSSTLAVDSGGQRWTALGVSGAPERAGREAGFLRVKMGDPCRRVKSIASQGGGRPLGVHSRRRMSSNGGPALPDHCEVNPCQKLVFLYGPCTVYAKLEVRRRGVAIRSIVFAT